MADDKRIDENRAVRGQLIDALQTAGLKVDTQYRIHGKGFTADVSGAYSFDPINVTIVPDYSLKKRGSHHSTYRVKRGEDASPAIAKAVAKAEEFAAAYVRALSAEDEAERRREEAEKAMREAALIHFPDFAYSGTTRSGLYFTRDSDNCSIHLVYRDDEVEVEKVVFDPYGTMMLAAAQAIVGVQSRDKAQTACYTEALTAPIPN